MNIDNELMKEIEDKLYMHGKISILIYKMGSDWILTKWGEFKQLSTIQEKLFSEYLIAGLRDEANSLTLIELPKDVNVIYRIISGVRIESELSKLGINLKEES